MDNFIILPNKNLLQEIRKDLNEDPDRLERQIDLFKQWLECEPHLPKDVDEHLIQTFVRSCKCNLEKSKEKFEKFLSCRIKLKTYYTRWNFDENFFKTLTVHKQLIVCPELSPKGYRVIMYRYPKDVQDFVVDEVIRYVLFICKSIKDTIANCGTYYKSIYRHSDNDRSRFLYLTVEYLFHEDISSGCIFICDMKEATIQHIAKINVGDALKVVDLIYNISPLRTKELHFLHLPKIAEALINLVIKVMSEKMQKRVRIHQDFDLTTCLSKHILPTEYGGTGMSFSEHGDMAERYFLQKQDMINKIENLKLVGPIPTCKKNLYSFEEFEMQGSFRKLSID